MTVRSIIATMGVAAHAAGMGGAGVTAPQQLTQSLLSDMRRVAEARPNGVPRAFDWALRPRTRPLQPRERFGALTGWGQLYRCAGRHVAPRDGVALRNLETFVLRRSTDRWDRVQATSELGGASFSEDYSARKAPARLFRRSTRETVAGVRPGFNFHFWPASGRVAVPSTDVAAVAVLVRARLDMQSRRRRTEPCFVLSAGADFWHSRLSSGVPRDAGIGRFKRVESRWRLFTMTSATSRQLERRPLPLAPDAEEHR